ncbi:MAG: DUF3429 domain-containing protein [Alphaproteobacteria bacterium]|nr:DUF3429 domain-containing protein [Alphaproteobacteria bacterium]
MDQVPRPALVLGIAGVLPFLAGTIGFWVLAHPYGTLMLVLELQYGAIILSFLGAVHWGLAIAGYGGAEPSWGRLGWSVTPALLGWVAIQFPPLMAIILLALIFGGAWAVDVRAVRQGFAPAWYAPLRKRLTIAVLICLLGTLLAVGRGPQ